MSKLTTEQFIQKARLKHGDRYDYSLVNYSSTREKVSIVCKIHGLFTKTPEDHLFGRGCPTCAHKNGAKDRAFNKEIFVKKSIEVHGNKYLYDKVEYVNSVSNVIITCKVHGDFSQNVASHLRGYGCKKCGSKKKMYDTESFVRLCSKVHSSKYDYSDSVYVNNTTKVVIKCPVHGNFMQAPANHLNGQGCPSCARGGIRYTLPTYLYVVTDGIFTKVGISNNSSKLRIKDLKSSGINFSEVKRYQFNNGYDASLIESKVLSKLKVKYKNPNFKFDGWTETFEDVYVAELLNIIEMEITELC